MNNTDLMFHLTITVSGVHGFVVRPEHDTDDIVGYVESKIFGGKCPVQRATFNLFTDAADPAVKYMLYQLHFTDGQGNPLTLSGRKIVKDQPGSDVWHATTTLYTRILKGHVDSATEEALADDPAKLAQILMGAGIIVIHMLDFMKQLTTFRVEAPTIAERLSALSEFGRLFFGKLWDVYARDTLTSSPF